MAVTEHQSALYGDEDPSAARGRRAHAGCRTLTFLPHVPSVVRVEELSFGPEIRDGRRSEQRIAQLIASAGTWEPIVVHRSHQVVVDGRLRVIAARRLGMVELPVVWFDGDDDERVVEFVRRNCETDDDLSTEERQEAVRHVLSAHPDWADRRIGELCGISPKTVAQVRSRVSDPDEACYGDRVERRVGRDGRSRPVDAAAQREKVAEALRDDPNASLRTIAGRVGVSPETVRRVRSAMRELDRADRPSVPSPEMLEAIFGRTQPPPWRGDASFRCREEAVTTAEFLERTDVTDADLGAHAESVPLSRVYEVADEARRRAAFWARLADCVEGRARRGKR